MNMKSEGIQKIDISSFEKKFQVMAYDLDMNYSSTMPVICNYLQEIGIAHGMKITADAGIDSEDIVFVLTRLHVKMERYPSWGDTVTVRSWLSPINNRYIIRNFKIYGGDDEVIGRAVNSAVPFDIKKRTGGIISGDLSGIQTLDAEPVLPHAFEKLTSVISPDYEQNLEVRYFDCDFYHHVNNVKYVEWCIESLPAEFIRNHKLYEIDINFRAEGNINDRLAVKSAAGSDPGVFNHAITGSGSGKDLVRMKSTWR